MSGIKDIHEWRMKEGKKTLENLHEKGTIDNNTYTLAIQLLNITCLMEDISAKLSFMIGDTEE